MKSILIPPIPHLSMSKDQEMHLLLSHLMGDQRYRDYYAAASARGDYIILDNSAHELKSGQPVKNLLTQSRDINADEIVIPDILFDGIGTSRSTEQSLNEIMKQETTWENLPRLMFVAQGKTYDELETCFLEQLIAFKRARDKKPDVFKKTPVFGVSKDYNEMFDGGLDRILSEAYLPAQELIDADIHLLGWCESLWDLIDLARKYGSKIRAVDSARPFVYGTSGIWLDPSKPFPPYPRRTKTYFQDTIPSLMMPTVDRNIAVFQSIAYGVWI